MDKWFAVNLSNKYCYKEMSYEKIIYYVLEE